MSLGYFQTFPFQFIFSDETVFEISVSRARRIRSSKCERVQESHMDLRKGYSVKVMIWGCISWRGLGRLAIVNGIMDSEKYIEVIQSHLLTQAAEWLPCGDWVFQQDGARCHTSRRTMQFFEELNIPIFSWTACAPDLNSIEIVRALLKEKVYKLGASSK